MKTHQKTTAQYRLEPSGEFIIDNYNYSKPFANFFPGIAGKFGIPMWVFYVNRAQGIIGLGTRDKDHSILEFFSANKAWQLVSSRGFRTFLKVSSGKKTIYYEPFHNGIGNINFRITNKMVLTAHDLTIEECNHSLGIACTVKYFTIPQEDFAALTRIVTIKNTSRASKKIELLDGLPQIVPFGTANLFLKKLGRTIEAWMHVRNLQNGVPFYGLSVDPTDRPEIYHITEGNFFLSFLYDKTGRAQIIKPVVDPESVFGSVTDFSYPERFLSSSNFSYPKDQICESRMPSGFSLITPTLGAQESLTFQTLVGYIQSQDALNAAIKKMTAPGYLSEKYRENETLIKQLQSNIHTESNSKEFDLYAQQTYLDNVIRGGYPEIFTSDNRSTVFYLYNRKHGDLERDYNKFHIQATYFSQGNGNYRDTNQNRRCDIWFTPEVGDEHVVTFLNLIQSDGFNPLVIKEALFYLKDCEKYLGDWVNGDAIALLKPFFNKPFTPGEIIHFMEKNGIELKISRNDFITFLLCKAIKIQKAEHGEGFWTDHWTYNLDLLENYCAVYPEKLSEILFNKRVFTFFDNSETVRARSEKYILKDGKVRQFHSVVPDTVKREMIKKREIYPNTVRKQYGKGEIYYTTLLNKLLCLVANKGASLDPFGIGIEMEADKPNWYDALNGLPGLLGSSLCETFELKRLILLLKTVLQQTHVERCWVTDEVYHFLTQLSGCLKAYAQGNGDDKDYIFWDSTHSIKEDYRYKTKYGLSGEETEMSSAELIGILDMLLDKINAGIEKARDGKKDIYYSYFINEVAAYELGKDTTVKPTRFVQKKLPLFLEGQMHALRLANDKKKASLLHAATKASPLFDKKLKMYKVTDSLKSMPEEIGRCRVFTPGWLEHASIWLHMEYKYILELLKNGLFAEFYEEFKNVLIAFQKPKQYGRSILENSSFLVSSAFPDKNLHGNGFVARLSGSTAEFIQLWLIMNVGKNPFCLDQNSQLNLKLQPALPGWMFTRKGTYTFTFLSSIQITYHNPGRKDTFGAKAACIDRITLKDTAGKVMEIASDTIPSPYAQHVRSRTIKSIDVYLK
jgi:hypothetical protein